MTVPSEYHLSFSLQAPKNSILGQFFVAPSGVVVADYLKQFLSYRPHPALTPYWVRLDCKEECIGLATLYLPPKPALLGAPVFISNFVIKPAYRGKGAGTYLLNALLGECRNRKITRLALAFAPESIGFWQSQGFNKSPNYPTLLFKELE